MRKDQGIGLDQHSLNLVFLSLPLWAWEIQHGWVIPETTQNTCDFELMFGHCFSRMGDVLPHPPPPERSAAVVGAGGSTLYSLEKDIPK